MRAFVAAFYLIACAIEFVLAFLFICQGISGWLS